MDDRWAGLTRRMQSEARSVLSNNQNDGVAIVSVHVLMKADGQPLVWVVKSNRLEPSRDAKAILLQILATLD